MKIFGTDYDGVIINIEPDKSQAFGEVLNKYWNVDVGQAAKFWLDKGGTPRRHKFDYFYEKKCGKKLSDKEYGKVEKIFSKILKEKFYPNVELMPGAPDLLKFARSNFDYTFISSGVTHEEIQYLTKLNNTDGYFDIILGTDEKYHSKMDHFKEILRNKDHEFLVFLADSPEDMKTGKKFDAITVGITTNHKEEELVSAGADYVCEDLFECKKFLQKILQKRK